jgi:conjugative relaxase-like TrwC/TraI family protein
MLSSGNMSVNTADDYHQKDGYHNSEGRGIYYGNLAEKEGLAGKEIGDEWHNLVRGKSVDGREAYIDHYDRDEKKQRGGTDLVFSDPKSVSIIREVYGDSQNPEMADLLKTIEQTRSESIKKTLDIIQDRYIATRGSVHGEQHLEPASGMFGIFEHHISRDGDPQSHTHCFLLQRVERTSDSQMRAHENNLIMRDRRWIGQYQSSLWASELQEKGIALTFNKDGSFEIAGVSKELRDYFSKASDRINDRVEKLLEQYPNADKSQLKEWANLETRPYKDREMTVEDQRCMVWKPEMEKLGHNEEKIIRGQKEAHSLNHEQPQKKISPNELLREAAAIATRQESVVKRSEILTTAAKLSNGLNPDKIEKAFDDAVKSGEIRYAQHANGYTTKEMIDVAKDTVTKLSQGRGTIRPVMNRAVTEKAVSEYRTLDGQMLTKDQQGALTMVLTSRDQFSAVYGFAGVGKTTMFKALNEISGEGHILGMSFTGKATSALTQLGGIETKTIDSHFVKGEVMERGKTYIIDEASFVGEKQMNQLVCQARESGTRLIFSGDTGQFKAISAGNPFKMMEGKIDSFHVTEIVRQEDSVDREISKMFGEGKAIEAVEKLIDRGSVTAINNHNDLIRQMVKDYFESGVDRTVLMTPYNTTRQELNQQIHDEAVARGAVGKQSYSLTTRQPVSIGAVEAHFAQSYEVGNYTFSRSGQGKGQEGRIIEVDPRSQTVTLEKKEGDRIAIDVRRDGEHLSVYREQKTELNSGEKVVFLKNDHHGKWNVTNGQTGIFKGIREDGLAIFSIDGKDRIAPANYNYFDRGWCITDVKAQGMSENKAMGLAPDNRASLYVMATRYKDQDGIKLYTHDLSEIRNATKILDDKYSAIGDREASQIAKDHDGRGKATKASDNGKERCR